MADVATLSVHLEETGTAQVVAALGRVEAAVKDTHQSTAQMGASIGVASAAATAGFNLIASAAGAALGAMKSLTEGTVGMNSSLEQSGIAFTTMLGSAEAAGAFLKELQQFAATTPFEFPQLQTAAKRMLAFGFSAKDIIPTLTAVGNAAAAMGSGQEGIDRITTALGQIQAKGKVAAEELLQLTEAGIPAWDMLAQKLGTDVAGAMDAVSKRTVDAKTFMEAFTQGTAARFGNMMEAQSHTFAGAMSTIKDTLGQLVGGAFKPFFDVLSGLADRLAQFAQTETVSVWAEDLKITLGALGPMFNDFTAWLSGQLPAAMSAAEAGAHGFVDGVHAIQDAFDAVQGKAAEFLTAVSPVTTWFGQLGEQLGDVPARIAADVGGMFDALGRQAEQFAAVWQGVMGAIGGQGAADTELSNLATVIHTVIDAFEALYSIQGTVFQTLQIAAVDALNGVLPKLEDLRAWLQDTIPPAIATIQEAWDGFWSHAGPMVQAMWNAVQPIIGAAIGIELAILQAALEKFKGVWDFVWGGIMTALEKVAPLMGALASTFGGAFAGLSDTITAALNSMQTPVAVAAEEVGTTIKNEIIKPLAPVGAEVAAAVGTTATAIATLGTRATTTAPAVASLGGAGTTAATGLATASKEAKTLDDVMSQLAKATTPEAVQQALLYQNANAALGEALKSLDLETAAQVQAMKNAGDVYGAARTALTALGATNDEAAAAVHGLASAHDVLAEAAYRATGALRAEQSVGARVAGVSGAGAFAGPPGVGAIPNQPLSAAEREAIAATGSGGARYGAQPGAGSMAGPSARLGPLVEAYMRAHPEEMETILTQILGPAETRVNIGAGPLQQAQFNAELQRRAELEQNIQAGQQIAGKTGAGQRTDAMNAAQNAMAAHTAAVQADADANKAHAVLVLEAGMKADALGQGMDYVGAAAARVYATTLQMGAGLAAAAAAAQGAAEQWKVVIATGQALMAGSMRNAGVIGGVTQKGLTYTEIMGGLTPGSTSGISTLGANPWGLPILSGSPITPGTLRGYADGGWVNEPVVGRGLRSGAGYAFGERGPEFVSAGGGGTVVVQMPVTVTGSDALRDPRLYEQLLDRGLTQAMRKRGLV